jgi:dienelactone hydrolase
VTTNEAKAIQTVSFPVKGDTVVGTLYPAQASALKTASGVPALVMGHGLSMTRDSGLARYAERFAAAGIAVLAFDYRCFGDSTGEPRELVSARQQVEDYHAALAYVRGLPGVDGERVAIWGTSYSGGVALQAAYEDGQQRALIMQVPNVDNAATGLFIGTQLARRAPLRGAWLAARAVLDFAAGVLGREAVYTQAMGREGEWAAYVNGASVSHVDGFRGPAWKNRIALRDFVRLPIFRPVRHAGKVRSPMFIATAEKDDLTPLAPVLRAARLAGERAELHRYDVTHFEVYNGALFEDLVTKQLAFLERALKA